MRSSEHDKKSTNALNDGCDDMSKRVRRSTGFGFHLLLIGVAVRFDFLLTYFYRCVTRSLQRQSQVRRTVCNV